MDCNERMDKFAADLKELRGRYEALSMAIMGDSRIARPEPRFSQTDVSFKEDRLMWDKIASDFKETRKAVNGLAAKCGLPHDALDESQPGSDKH